MSRFWAEIYTAAQHLLIVSDYFNIFNKIPNTESKVHSNSNFYSFFINTKIIFWIFLFSMPVTFFLTKVVPNISFSLYFRILLIHIGPRVNPPPFQMCNIPSVPVPYCVVSVVLQNERKSTKSRFSNLRKKVFSHLYRLLQYTGLFQYRFLNIYHRQLL